MFVYQALFLRLVSVPVFISQPPALLPFVSEQLTPFKMRVVSRGRQGLVSQLNKLLSMESMIKKNKENTPCGNLRNDE